jgi:hypothetical protein
MPQHHNFQVMSVEEDATHRHGCQDAPECGWCAVLKYMEKFQAAFQMVDDRFQQSTQYQALSEKNKRRACSSWLGKAHRGDKVFLGCIPCHALRDARVTNDFANYNISADRLQTPSGKPHVLLRHADSKVHKTAVHAFLDVQITGAAVKVSCYKGKLGGDGMSSLEGEELSLREARG